eukprot:764495-Hanusia_phi.AAC.3
MTSTRSSKSVLPPPRPPQPLLASSLICPPSSSFVLRLHPASPLPRAQGRDRRRAEDSQEEAKAPEEGGRGGREGGEGREGEKGWGKKDLVSVDEKEETS